MNLTQYGNIKRNGVNGRVGWWKGEWVGWDG